MHLYLVVVDVGNVEDSVPIRQFASGFFLELLWEERRNVDRILENRFASLLHREHSWLPNPVTSFGDVLFSSFNLGFEFFLQFQAVFKDVLQPIAELLLFLRGQLSNIGLDLLQRFHCCLINSSNFRLRKVLYWQQERPRKELLGSYSTLGVQLAARFKHFSP